MAKLPPRELILHVGQPKAGSTSIQNYLEKQRKPLLEQRVLFPQSYFARRNPFDPERGPGHIDLINAAKNGDLSELWQEMTKTKARTLIVSTENLFADQPPETFKAIATGFAGWTIRLIAVLRRPERWITSRYVEEVMSSHHRFGHMTLPQFVTHFGDWLLYSDRLEMMARILKPESMSLINYDAALAGRGLLTEFLECAKLPITDASLVSGMRANVREKEDFLIEGKRRLNTVSPVIPVKVRQEIEHEIRTYVKSRTDQGQASLPDFPKAISLEGDLAASVQASNQQLVAKFDFSPAFGETTFPPFDAQAHRRSTPEMTALLDFGLKTTARVLRKTDIPPDSAAALSLLHHEGSEQAIDLLVQSTTSVHLDSPESALWGARMSAKRSFLLTEKSMLSEADKALDAKLPSDVISIFTLAMLQKLLGKNAPDFIFVAPGVASDRIARTWAVAGAETRLVLMGYRYGQVQSICEKLELTCRTMLGAMQVLSRSDSSEKD